MSQFIQAECGLKMPPAKKTLLETRLRKRLRSLALTSFAQYCDYVFSPQGVAHEVVHLIDLMTTNKTDFFREPVHFNYLVQQALPELLQTYGARGRRKLRVWSAGCASGEEPYTLAMVLSEFAESRRGFDFSILATDISTRVLEKGRLGIYDEEWVKPVPTILKRKYFLRSKDRSKKLVRIIPDLRARVQFGRLNLVDNNFAIGRPVDIIFCRNVFIYFERPTQLKVLRQFCQHLAPDGYIFLGLTETLGDLNTSLVRVASTVYRQRMKDESSNDSPIS